jgi:hypothetical protein
LDCTATQIDAISRNCRADGSLQTGTNSSIMLHRPDSLCRSRSLRIGTALRLKATALRQLPRGHHATMPLISSSIITPDQHTTCPPRSPVSSAMWSW